MGEDDSPAKHGCSAIHHVGAAVRVDSDLAVVLPVLRADIEHRDAAEALCRDSVLITLQQGRGLGLGVGLCVCSHLLPAGKVVRLGERRHQRRVLQGPEKCLRLLGDGLRNVHIRFARRIKLRHLIMTFCIQEAQILSVKRLQNLRLVLPRGGAGPC